MRKRKKEQILSLLQSYEEAHSTLRSFITEGREKEATSLLALCQEGMEKIEGEVTVAEYLGYFTDREDSIFSRHLKVFGMGV